MLSNKRLSNRRLIQVLNAIYGPLSAAVCIGATLLCMQLFHALTPSIGAVPAFVLAIALGAGLSFGLVLALLKVYVRYVPTRQTMRGA